jgi:glycerol-3-phosphate acyltransferase PlsY
MCAITFFVVVWISKYVSLGSILGTVFSPIFVLLVYGSGESFFMYFCCALAIMVIYTHRTNIERLKLGTESKFSFNKRPEIEIK